MYRNTSTIFRLVEALKDCHYIRNQAEFVTKDQLRRIYEYLDDVAIDLFFQNVKLKTLVLTKNEVYRRFTPAGAVKNDEDITLDMSNMFDRATFIESFLQSIYNNRSELRNSFLANLMMYEKVYCGGCSFLTGYHLPLYGTLFPVYEFDNQCDFFKLNKITQFCVCKDYYAQEKKLVDIPSFIYLDIPKRFEEFMYEYIKCKDDIAFGNYTWEEAIFVYCLLVEKLSFIYEDNLTGIVALTQFNEYCRHINEHNWYKKFFEFEWDLNDILDPEKDLSVNDLFLRFTNLERTKAFNYEVDDRKPELMTLRLFDGEEVKHLRENNPIPLPFNNYKRDFL